MFIVKHWTTEQLYIMEIMKYYYDEVSELN